MKRNPDIKLKSMIIDKEAFFQEKITGAYADRLFKEFEEHGEQVIETFREEQPVMYLRIVHELVPEIDVLAHMKALDPYLTDI